MEKRDGIVVAICDDREVEREIMRDLCDGYFPGKVTYEIREYDSGEAFLAAGEEPDILLSDISMGELSGVDVKDRLLEQGSDTIVVFASYYESAPSGCTGENVMGFFSKPIAPEDFAKKMDEVLLEMEARKETVTVETQEGAREIFLRSILYMKGKFRGTEICLRDGSVIFDGTKKVDQWRQQLDEKGFFFCRRKYLLHVRYIRRIGQELKMDGGASIRVNSREQEEAMRKFAAYFRRCSR